MKYFTMLLFITILLLVPSRIFAASLALQHVPKTIGQQEQFYVDITADAQSDSFNAIQTSVTYSSDTLTFVRAETGRSLITSFIDQPKNSNNNISFSGIIVGGFDGVINPFDQKNKLPGTIIRLVFAGKKAGPATIAVRGTVVTKTDGKGTVEQVPDVDATLVVTTAIAPSIYTTQDTIAPTISASVVNDKNLFDGQAVLVFTATDKDSGVDHIELQEGNSPLSTIESPYLLHDQSRKAILSLHVYDVAGNVTTVTIDPTTQTPSATIIIALLLGTIIILYVIYKKTHFNKKNTKNN